jgi:hypothetical protein
MSLYTLSVVIFCLTFVFRVILKERLKDLKEAIASAEAIFNSETSASAIKLQITKMEMDANQRDSASLKKAKRTGDFSKFILQGRLAVAQRRAELGIAEQGVIKLLKAFPRRSGNASLKSFSPIREKVKEALSGALEVERSSLMAGNDWSQSSLLQLQVLKLALVELQVALFADAVLKRAAEVREAAERLYSLCNRIGYFLYAVGIGIAVYASRAGIKTMLGGE